MLEIKGKLVKIIFHNDQNSYTVGLLRVKESDNKELVNKTITFTGILPDLNEVDTYIMKGNLIDHIKYGQRFEVTSIDRIMPKEVDAITDVLASDLFKGIGRKTATKIVDTFKEKTFDVILNNPKKLEKIKGLTKKQINTLQDSLRNYQGSYEDILKLTKLGFNTSDSMKIYNYYKNRIKDVLDNNLYNIYYDIEEISFSKVDAIYSINYPKDSVNRIAAAIIYIIKTLSMTYGHTYFSKEEVNSYLFRVLKVEVNKNSVEDAYNNLLNEQRIVIKDDRLYIKDMYEAETSIAKRLRLLAHSEEIKYKDLDDKIK